MHRLAAVLGVVEDDVDDRATERHARAEVVDEGVVQALLVSHPVREGRERRVGALVAFDQQGHRTVVSLGIDRLLDHQPGPELDVEDHVLERRAQRPVSDIERLIEPHVGQASAQFQETCRGPVVVVQHTIKQIHPIPSTTTR
jgi:hypothetical protein